MANYSQYTDHNEIGGVSVGLEDAKLASAASKSVIAATDYVLMKDANGDPVKILKSDFNEAVRAALGGILSTESNGTAIGKVATLATTTNNFGSTSVSDLASVLGVSYGFKGYTVDNPDEARTPGFFFSNNEISCGIVLYYNQANFFQFVVYGGSGADTFTVKVRRWSNSIGFGAWITLA